MGYLLQARAKRAQFLECRESANISAALKLRYEMPSNEVVYIGGVLRDHSSPMAQELEQKIFPRLWIHFGQGKRVGRESEGPS